MSEHHTSGQAHGSVKEYSVGLLLSLLLTFLPFGLVLHRLNALETGADTVSVSVIMIVIIICAVAQLLVQAIFFLHMNSSSSQAWNTSSALFVISVILFVVVGTIWIFNHLNHNMLMGH